MAEPGFAEVDQKLNVDAKVQLCKEWEKIVVMLIDEMYIKENLVFNKHSGALIGFVDLCEINNHLIVLERSLDEMITENLQLPKNVMTIMVRGLFTYLRYVHVYVCHCDSLNCISLLT